MGQPVPFLLAPQEARPITAMMAKTINKIFLFIVKNLVVQGFYKTQRYKFT